MSQYYCPYCSPRYQFHKQRSDGVMVCGLCGDQLTKKPFIKPTQIFALIATSAFIAPFLLLVITSLRNLNSPKPQRKTPTIVVSPEIIRLANKKVIR